MFEFEGRVFFGGEVEGSQPPHVSIQPEQLRYSTYRLLLHVRIGSLPAHKLLLDTGSSTVAFCNMTLPSTLPGANQTQFKACEQHLGR